MEPSRSQTYAIQLPAGTHQTLSQGQSNYIQEDIHICGGCKQSFTDIRFFLEHKNACNSLITSASLLDSSTVNLILSEQPLLEVVIDCVEKVGSVFLHQSLSNEDTITTRRDFHVDEEDVASLLANQFAKEAVNITSDSQPEPSVDSNLTIGDAENTILQGETQTQLDNIIKNSVQTCEISVPEAVEPLLEISQDSESDKNKNSDIENGKNYQRTNLTTKKVCACSQCDFITLYSNDLTRHMRKHTGERPYECSVCKQRFARKDKLQTHFRTHTGEKPYKCQFCNYAAIDICPLRKHLRTHTDERPFKCQFCSYSARDSSQLTIHLRTHTGDAPFLCQFEKCGRSFKTSSDLKRHGLIHSRENTFHCSQCEFKATSKISLQAHNRLKHEGGDLLKCPEEGCGYTANGVKKLRTHQKSHTGNKTNIMIEGSRKKSNARSKTNSKAHACTLCNEQTQTQSSLKVHIHKQHSANGSKTQPRLLFHKAFQCTYCPASFVRQDSWRSHVKQHQSNSQLDADEMVMILPEADVMQKDSSVEEQVEDASIFFMDSQETLEHVGI